jgi:hypothetical protein
MKRIAIEDADLAVPLQLQEMLIFTDDVSRLAFEGGRHDDVVIWIGNYRPSRCHDARIKPHESWEHVVDEICNVGIGQGQPFSERRFVLEFLADLRENRRRSRDDPAGTI